MQIVATDHRTLLIPADWFFHSFASLLIPFLLVVAWKACSLFGLHGYFSSFRMRRSCVQSQGLLCLLAQLRERGGDTTKWTWGEQDRTEEAHQPSSRNCIYSFMWGVTAGAVPEPNKRTSGSACFWPNHQKQNPFPLAGTCVYSPALAFTQGLQNWPSLALAPYSLYRSELDL